MTNKKLFQLGIAALFMLIMAVVVTTFDGKEENTFARGSYLVQGINPAMVYGIRVTLSGETLALKKNDKLFGIVEKYGYRAENEKVNGIFNALLNIRTDTKVTSEKDNFKDLGVDGGAESTVVHLLDASNKKILGVVIGKPDKEYKKNYVRLEESDDVYLSKDKVIPLSAKPQDYYNSRLFPGKGEDYTRLVVKHESGEYEIARGKNGLGLVECPAGKKEDETAVVGAFNAVVQLRIEDMMPLIEFKGKKMELTGKLYKSDMTVYGLQFGEMEGNYYVVVTADVDYHGGELQIRQDESDESLREKEKVLLAGDKVMEFGSRHEGWIYMIDKETVDRIRKSTRDLLAKPAKKT